MGARARTARHHQQIELRAGGKIGLWPHAQPIAAAKLPRVAGDQQHPAGGSQLLGLPKDLQGAHEVQLLDVIEHQDANRHHRLRAPAAQRMGQRPA
jgi:hypothetical protein